MGSRSSFRVVKLGRRGVEATLEVNDEMPSPTSRQLIAFVSNIPLRGVRRSARPKGTSSQLPGETVAAARMLPKATLGYGRCSPPT